MAGKYVRVDLRETDLVSARINCKISPDDFAIDKVFRFEGISASLGDEPVIYAVSSTPAAVVAKLAGSYSGVGPAFNCEALGQK